MTPPSELCASCKHKRGEGCAEAMHYGHSPGWRRRGGVIREKRCQRYERDGHEPDEEPMVDAP